MDTLPCIRYRHSFDERSIAEAGNTGVIQHWRSAPNLAEFTSGEFLWLQLAQLPNFLFTYSRKNQIYIKCLKQVAERRYSVQIIPVFIICIFETSLGFTEGSVTGRKLCSQPHWYTETIWSYFHVDHGVWGSTVKSASHKTYLLNH